MFRYSEQICFKLLNIAAGSGGGGSSKAGILLRAQDRNRTTLLDTLIACEQKQVVKQAVVQQHLSDVWNGMWIIIQTPPTSLKISAKSRLTLKLRKIKFFIVPFLLKFTQNGNFI